MSITGQIVNTRIKRAKAQKTLDAATLR